MAFILLAYVPMIISIGGRTIVRLIAKKGVQAMIKKGAKKLTKANFKKSYEFFRGTKKLKISDKNKVLENLNIITKKVPKKVIPKKVIPKKVIPKKAAPKEVTPKEDWLKGIRKNESLEGFLKRKVTEEAAKLKVVPKQVKVPEVIKNLAAARAGKITKVAPKLAKETDDIIAKIAAARASKTIKLSETAKVKQIIEKAKPVKEVAEKVVAPAVEVAKKTSTAWDKAKTAMKLAGWSLPVIAAGGIFFYSTRDKKVEPKVTVDLKSDVTTAEDVTVTTAKPEIKIPPIDPADPFFKKRDTLKGDTLANKIQSLDTKDYEIITPDHPLVSKDIVIPGSTKKRIDTGL